MRFSCGVCAARFRSKHELDVHDVTQHSQQRRYQCHLCKKTFHRRSVLRDHIELHAQDTTGAEPFTCAHCGKLFRQKKNLGAHVKVVHLKERRFQCDVCARSFCRRYMLREHLESSRHRVAVMRRQVKEGCEDGENFYADRENCVADEKCDYTENTPRKVIFNVTSPNRKPLALADSNVAQNATMTSENNASLCVIIEQQPIETVQNMDTTSSISYLFATSDLNRRHKRVSSQYDR